MNAVSHNVGTQLIFENARVRVWRMTLEPGEASQLHQHRYDYLFVNVSRAHVALQELGQEPVTRTLDEDFVQYSVVGTAGQPPHQLTNVGDSTVCQILVEFLGDSVSPHARDPETNGRFG